MTRIALALFLMLPGTGSLAFAQRSPEPREAVPQIGARLRAFYYNLGRHDWEALTADILAAKVVAHRPAPAAMVMSEAGRDENFPMVEVICTPPAQVSVEGAVITLEGDWAEVSVPRCSPEVGADEFRLIHFEDRWRFVYIHLFQQPVTVTVER